MRLDPDKWGKFGVHILFDLKEFNRREGTLIGELEITCEDLIGKIDFFGVNLDVVDYYEDLEDLLEYFKQRTSIYLPEIYFFNIEESFFNDPEEFVTSNLPYGKCVVLKSCNRCTRYLLIDVENERNTISYSNHCVSKAPCIHPSFSSYNVVYNECDSVPEYIASHSDIMPTLDDKYVISKIKTHYGYQLECRVCKKYYVNAPLNPLRSSTQHREDSLRRRALEVLVDNLLDREWIYFDFRLKNGVEFDVYIWEKFDKKCFNCGKSLETPSDMHLDHTMPLSYLYPLDKTATCLCATCNNEKRDKFPIDFYPTEKIEQLCDITGLDPDLAVSREVNIDAVNALKTNIVWFFDEFLSNKNYQKIRAGKRTSDLIFKAVQDIIFANSSIKIDMVKEYVKIKHKKPKTITII